MFAGALLIIALDVTVIWALANIGIIGGVVGWARGVHHRRRSHRFPVALEAAYAAAPERIEIGHAQNLYGPLRGAADGARPW